MLCVEFGGLQGRFKGVEFLLGVALQFRPFSGPVRWCVGGGEDWILRPRSGGVCTVSLVILGVLLVL